MEPTPQRKNDTPYFSRTHSRRPPVRHRLESVYTIRRGRVGAGMIHFPDCTTFEHFGTVSRFVTVKERAMATTAVGLLTDTMLETIRSRAATYDRENRFFQEDFDELKAAGYLMMS